MDRLGRRARRARALGAPGAPSPDPRGRRHARSTCAPRRVPRRTPPGGAAPSRCPSCADAWANCREAARWSPTAAARIARWPGTRSRSSRPPASSPHHLDLGVPDLRALGLPIAGAAAPADRRRTTRRLTPHLEDIPMKTPARPRRSRPARRGGAPCARRRRVRLRGPGEGARRQARRPVRLLRLGEGVRQGPHPRLRRRVLPRPPPPRRHQGLQGAPDVRGARREAHRRDRSASTRAPRSSSTTPAPA